MSILDFSKMKNNESSIQQSNLAFSRQKPIQLLLKLQQSLEIDEIVDRFSELIDLDISIDGYSYVNRPEAIDCQNGHRNRHRIAYTLKLEEQHLGEFIFYRSKPFSEAESEFVENMLGLVVYPLRNALLYRQALRMAYTDSLTGLCNRSNMIQQIQREISLARRERRPMSLVMVDIDHFKHINDRHGHLSGDQVIQCVAQGLRQSLRDFDLIFRYGGEEFVIVMGGADEQAAIPVAERMRKAIAALRHPTEGGESIAPTISLGVTGLSDKDNPESLIARADQAMYQAKKTGRNRICCL